MSPKIHEESGYVFYFVAHDVWSNERPHVHVGEGRQNPRSDAKFWLDDLGIHMAGRFGRRDISRMQKILREQRTMLLGEWDEFRRRI